MFGMPDFSDCNRRLVRLVRARAYSGRRSDCDCDWIGTLRSTNRNRSPDSPTQAAQSLTTRDWCIVGKAAVAKQTCSALDEPPWKFPVWSFRP